MRRPISLVVRFFVVLAMAGCVRTAVTPFATGPRYPALPLDSVVVYTDPAAVPGTFEQLAIVSAKGDFTLYEEADLVRALRKEAGELGANGLLLAGVRSPSGTQRVVGVLFGGEHGLRRGQAVAIRVRPDSVRSGAGASAP